MPNIVVVGPHQEFIVEEITSVVTRLGVKPEDGVISYGNLCCVDMTQRHGNAPYLIVRDTNPEHAMVIATALNEQLGVGVEVEVLKAFLPREDPPF
jgi:hypothetical protein